MDNPQGEQKMDDLEWENLKNEMRIAVERAETALNERIIAQIKQNEQMMKLADNFRKGNYSDEDYQYWNNVYNECAGNINELTEIINKINSNRGINKGCMNASMAECGTVE